MSSPNPSETSPLVSVIMPVYQGEALIERAVHSVLNQTYPHLELLVVDDGSTDNTPAILCSITDPRMRILTQENSGVATARNLAISQAKGEYIAFLDTDDLWFPEKLAVDLETIRRHGQPICLVYSGYYAVDEQERLVNISFPYRDAGDLSQAVLLNEGILLPSTTMMHRQVVHSVGGFPADSYHEDRVFFIRACRQFPAFPTKQRLVVYRQTLSGRCRRILADYHKALTAECSIVESLQSTLSPAELDLLMTIQVRNLFYRFLMYNFVGSAQTLFPQVDRRLLLGNKKGLLALLSMLSGFNWLYMARIIAQAFSRYGLYPWWCWKRQSAYPLIKRSNGHVRV